MGALCQAGLRAEEGDMGGVPLPRSVNWVRMELPRPRAEAGPGGPEVLPESKPLYPAPDPRGEACLSLGNPPQLSPPLAVSQLPALTLPSL